MENFNEKVNETTKEKVANGTETSSDGEEIDEEATKESEAILEKEPSADSKDFIDNIVDKLVNATLDPLAEVGNLTESGVESFNESFNETIKEEVANGTVTSSDGEDFEEEATKESEAILEKYDGYY